ncbi:MAG TPA: hypothetical protein VFD37_01360, partial [Solirubrobacterales bacterium]|nr:hypothetical protein [Solirubrobacterales bacterium]
TENAAGTNAFTAFGAETVCPGSEYTGHKVDVTNPKQRLEGGETEVTISPHYKNCENGSGAERIVHMNSCDYEFYDFITAGGVAGTYSLLARIQCDVPGDEIEVTKTPFCPVKVPAQDGLTGLHATNEGNKIRISGSIHNVTATHCVAGHTNVAKQHQDVTVEGQDAEGGTTAISISH